MLRLTVREVGLNRAAPRGDERSARKRRVCHPERYRGGGGEWKRKTPPQPKSKRGKTFQSGPGATRTRDLLLRRQALYPTELRTRGCGEGKLGVIAPLYATVPRAARSPRRRSPPAPRTPSQSSIAGNRSTVRIGSGGQRLARPDRRLHVRSREAPVARAVLRHLEPLRGSRSPRARRPRGHPCDAARNWSSRW